MDTDAKITIETFKTVTKAIAQSDNLDIMTNHLTQLLVVALDIKGSAIFVLNPETKELEILASFGLSPKYLSKGPIMADKSIAANLRGEPVIIPDVVTDKNIQYPEEAKKEGISSIVSFPIVFRDEIIGALRLYHHEVWNVPEQDFDSLHLLAENIGLAMTYTRLLNAIQSITEVVNMAVPKDLLS
jgi:transcriptional regulator with GAF, ATPase, and Fis domain